LKINAIPVVEKAAEEVKVNAKNLISEFITELEQNTTEEVEPKKERKKTTQKKNIKTINNKKSSPKKKTNT